MVDIRYLLVDENTGDALAELPLQVDGAIPFGMNSVGQFEASLPADHPEATQANLTDGLRGITVIRDDSAEWSGLIGEVDVDSDARRVSFPVYEASEWMSYLTVEEDKHYNADRFSWVRKVNTYVNTKLSTSGDGTGSPGSTINAGIPRWSVSTGLSGFTLDDVIPGLSRFTMAEIVQILTEDPSEGIEWRMDYQTGSTRQSCHRTLTLGAPLGVTKTQTLTAQVLHSWGKTYDVTTAATRVHVRGNGFTATKQNTGSITAGWPLMEQRYDRGDTTNQTRLGNIAKEYRRRAQPPVKMLRATYVPGVSLPFGWCNIGDTVPFNIKDPCDLLNIQGVSRRVVGIEWTPPSGATPELVSLLFNLPLTDLGT